ncbi:MAG: bifunctional oligoribonuclease/PAP phosphatase NrnA [Bacteroidetes bacterium]|nr:MAG: bifunctional oligoribonuclease/PAP phosphatase NrnA [Bacteroidota bacterium]MBL1146010.1 bifunctional oligoribonuclease/PAP phosphatase NrnA [Bacteroidota bacterium]NOG58804.1 bifunctional oligoribonuclease/PAP phosphatase NrnA [Bacteroidota bacterium]
MQNNWEKLNQELFTSSKRVIILSHRSPDGDSVGSSFGLYHFLKKFNHHVQVITPDPVPPFIHWIPEFETAINYEKQKDESFDAIRAADIIFCLDFNTPSRMGNMEFAFDRRSKDAYVINIDHHQQPDNFAHFQISDTSASSTAQLIFDFIIKTKGKTALDAQIAQCLYAGILTDTGSFRFSSTSPHTHRVVADLLETGIDVNAIYQKIYDNYSQDRIKLLGFALKDKLKLYPEYHTAIIDLSEKELNSFQFQKGDTEGIVNFPLSISWVKMSVLLTQKDGIVKMSFRSKGNFSVNELARNHFNGGGHENASGGMSTLSMQETLKQLESILPDYKQKLDESKI